MNTTRNLKRGVRGAKRDTDNKNPIRHTPVSAAPGTKKYKMPELKSDAALLQRSVFLQLLDQLG